MSWATIDVYKRSFPRSESEALNVEETILLRHEAGKQSNL